jgi:uncharacterized protein
VGVFRVGGCGRIWAGLKMKSVMKFEWDENKNKLNQQKHGISFEDAKTVFDDPLQISKLDHRFSYFEERWITIGTSKNLQLLVVVNMFFTDDGEEIIRIISARNANPKERASYEKC